MSVAVAVAVGFPSAGPRALAPLLGLQRARRLHADCVSVCAAVWQLPQSQPNTTRTAAAWHAGRQREEEWEEVEELEGGKVTLAVNRKALTFGYVLPLISSHNQCSHNNGNGEVTHAHNASRDNERTISISAFPFYNDDCKSKACRLDGTERSRGGDNLLADGNAIDVRNLYSICVICMYVYCI